MYKFIIPLGSLIILNTTLRLFTNHLNIIPRVFNLTDIFIVVWIFILFLFYIIERKVEIQQIKILLILLIFNLVLFFGIILNFQFIFLQPTGSQIIMLNEGILLFIAIVNLPYTIKDIYIFRKILLISVFFQILLGFIQIPLNYSNKGSDWITGTFYGNHEQYGGFILIGLYYFLGLSFVRRKIYTIPIIAILILTILVDNKASWLGIFFALNTLFIIYLCIEDNTSRKFLYLLFSFFVVFLGLITALNSSKTLYKFERIVESFDNEKFLKIGKVYAFFDIWKSYQENPYTIFVGSGPGTFYSRASSVFYPLKSWGRYDFSRNPLFLLGRRDELKWSDSMGGVINPLENQPYFLKFAKEGEINFLGSRQLDEPWSTYASLLGETGIMGTILYLAIYVIVFRQLLKLMWFYKNNIIIFPLIIASIGFMVYLIINSVYNNWIETGRMVTILWAMIGIVYKYHYIIRRNLCLIIK